MEVRETSTLGMEFVQVGGLQERVPMTTKVAIALVIRHHQNNVWTTSGRLGFLCECDAGIWANEHAEKKCRREPTSVNRIQQAERFHLLFFQEVPSAAGPIRTGRGISDANVGGGG